MRSRFIRWTLVLLLILAAVWPVTEAQTFPRFYRNGTHPTTEWDGIHLIARQTGHNGKGTDVTLEYWRDAAGRWREEVIEAGIGALVGSVNAYDGARFYRLVPNAQVKRVTPMAGPVHAGGYFSPLDALRLRDEVQAGRATARSEMLDGQRVVLIESVEAAKNRTTRYWIDPEVGLIRKVRAYEHDREVSAYDLIQVDWQTPLPPFPTVP